MMTILSVWAVGVLFVIIHVEAVTDEEYKSVLARLSVLEGKQAFSERRIAVLEQEKTLSQKRIDNLEKYKKCPTQESLRLKEKNMLCNRRKDALDILTKLYAKNVALETDKILLDEATTTDGYDTTLSQRKLASLQKEKIVSDINIATAENDYALSPNRSSEEDKHTAAVKITNRATAVLPSDHRRFVAEGIVAFSAMNNAGQRHIGINQNILFEVVLTNEGGGYHPNHGVFIAPQSGLYVLSSSILTNQNGEFDAAIVHNGNAAARFYGHGDSGRHDQGSQTVVIKLNAGDEVAVQNIVTPDNSIYGELYSSFSGYLLWPQ